MQQVRKAVEKKAADCSFKILSFQRKLNRETAAYEKHMSALAINRFLSEKVKNGRSAKGDAEWLATHNNDVDRRLENNNPAAHAMMQLQIDVLSAQLKVYEDFVAANR
jgi:hypothetical protein